MFKSKTVFILGAGASHEIGLPVGSMLAKIISKKLDIRFERGLRPLEGGDWRLYELLKRRFPAENVDYQHAGWAIRDGVLLANSIDDYLDRHYTNERIVRYGKLGIVASILEGERKSKLFVERNHPREKVSLSRIDDAWYFRFMQIAGAGVSAQNLDHLFDNVAFVDFNYDRCLQQFLVEALQPLYNISEERAWQVVSKLSVLHPYGSVGDLRSAPRSDQRVPFGDPDGNADLFHLSDRIRIYTEQVSDHGVIESIRDAVASARTIVFLGFAYHEQNLALITPSKTKQAQAVFGTAYGISDVDCEVVNASLTNLLGKAMPRIKFETSDRIQLRNDLTCSALLDEYSRTLVATR